MRSPARPFSARGRPRLVLLRPGRIGSAFLEWRRRSIGSLPGLGDGPPPSWVPPWNPAAAGEPYWPETGWEVLAFGRTWPLPRSGDGSPEWARDPIHGVPWPAGRASGRIDFRGPSRPGDPKCVWEPSRFGHLFDLARRPAGAGEAARHVSSWIEQNRWLLGPHWDNGLEASLRAVAWAWADGVLAPGGDAAWTAVRAPLRAALWHHAAFVESRLDRGALNHLVGDGAGLAVIGASYPDLPGAARFRDAGIEILRGEIGRQILPDGSHVERAPAYARLVADLYLVAGLALRPGAPGAAADFVRAAERLLECLLLQTAPASDLPGYGDDDGATVLWTSRAEHRLGVSLGLAAAMTGRTDFKGGALASGALPRARDVLRAVAGGEDLARLDALEAGDPPAAGTVSLADGGVVVHRAAGRHCADWLLFRCGPSGTGKGAHAHMDQLQVLWSPAAGVRLVDPGTPTYGGDDAARYESTATPAHNTVSVDGASQAERRGRFEWSDLPRGEILEMLGDASSLRVAGRVRYRTAGRPVEHRRTVERSGGRLRILDEVTSPGALRATATLLFQGEMRWDAAGRTLRSREGPSVALAWQGWTDFSIGPASFHPVYGEARRATRVVLGALLRDPLSASIELEMCGA